MDAVQLLAGPAPGAGRGRSDDRHDACPDRLTLQRLKKVTVHGGSLAAFVIPYSPKVCILSNNSAPLKRNICSSLCCNQLPICPINGK